MSWPDQVAPSSRETATRTGGRLGWSSAGSNWRRVYDEGGSAQTTSVSVFETATETSSPKRQRACHGAPNCENPAPRTVTSVPAAVCAAVGCTSAIVGTVYSVYCSSGADGSSSRHSPPSWMASTPESVLAPTGGGVRHAAGQSTPLSEISTRVAPALRLRVGSGQTACVSLCETSGRAA